MDYPDLQMPVFVIASRGKMASVLIVLTSSFPPKMESSVQEILRWPDDTADQQAVWYLRIQLIRAAGKT